MLFSRYQNWVVKNLLSKNNSYERSDQNGSFINVNFKQIADHITDGVIIFNQKRQVEFLNEVAKFIFDVNDNEIIGQGYVDSVLYPVLYSENLILSNGLAGKKELYEIEINRNHGKTKSLEIRESIVGDSTIGHCFYLWIIKDVTEIKHKQKALRVLENKFTSLFDNNPDGLLIADPETRKFISANSKICEMLGYSLSEILSLGVSDIHPQESLVRVLEEFNLMRFSNKPLAEYIPVLRKDRTIFYADINLANVEVEDKRYLVGIFRDITHRKIMLDSLQLSEEQFRTAFENSSIGMALVAIDGSFLRVNKSLCGIVGYTPAELLKMTFIDITHQDDLTDDIKQGNLILNGELPFSEIKKRYIHKNGEPIWVQVNLSMVRNDDLKPLYFVSQIQNINNSVKAEAALVRSRNKLQIIIDNVPFNIFWKDNNNRYLGCNKKFADFIGMSVDEVVGKTDYQMPWSNHASSYILDDNEVFVNKKAKLNIEEITENNLKEKFWVRTNKVPLLNEEGEVISVIGIFEDITENKKLRDELDSYRNHLETLVKMQTFDLKEAQRIAKIGNWRLDGKNNTLYWSDEVFSIFEKDLANFTPTIEDFDNSIHPNDWPNVHGVFQESIKNRTSFSIEHRIIVKNGKVKWVHERCENYFDSEGNHIYSIGTVQDISYRKEMELEIKRRDYEFELFFENINEVVILLDSKGRTIYVNSEYENVFGLKKRMQYLNTFAFIETVQSSENLKLKEFISSYSNFPEKSTPFSLEFKIAANQSESKWIYLKGVPVLGIEPGLNRMILLMSDITKSKQLQREILNTIINSEEKERTRFAQDLHDGLGPLISTVKLYIQWLAKADTISDKADLLNLAESTIDEALQSIREISRNLSPHVLTRYGLTAALLNFIDRLKNSKNVNICFSNSFNFRLDFETETTLYRIAVECINNALRYSDAKKINIEIEHAENLIIMTISDNGIGFNLEEVLASRQGLGLFNIYNRIETIGGCVNINTNHQKGTIIQITTPLIRLTSNNSI